MPRGLRKKSPDSIYHVMVKSIAEVKMFKETRDKEFYLYLIRTYQLKYSFKIYAYCIMDNHAHLILDANGADISKIMHGINFTFAQNYNRTHNRAGTLFQDRFKSKIIQDERYIMTLSAYIHNNPKAIEGYETTPEKYEYSSLAAYIGLKKDVNGILNEAFIMQMFGRKKSVARKNYIRLLNLIGDELIEENEFINDKTEYRSGRKILVRNLDPKEIVRFVSMVTNTNIDKVHVKSSRSVTEAKALSILLMKNLCNYRCVDICEIFGNITIGRVSKLCSMGVKLIDDEGKYNDIISRFIREYAN